MADGDRAFECLELISRACLGTNFLTYHNDWRRQGITLDMRWGRRAPLQLDANMGWTAAVQEMLLYSKPGFIKLIPALPKKWSRGTISGLQCRGGVTVSLRWDLPEGRVFVSCESNEQQILTVALPRRIRFSETSLLLRPHPQSDRFGHLELPAGEPVNLTIVLEPE